MSGIDASSVMRECAGWAKYADGDAEAIAAKRVRLARRRAEAVRWLRKVEADRVEALGAMRDQEAVEAMSHAELGACMRRRLVRGKSGIMEWSPRGPLARYSGHAAAEMVRRREAKAKTWSVNAGAVR